MFVLVSIDLLCSTLLQQRVLGKIHAFFGIKVGMLVWLSSYRNSGASWAIFSISWIQILGRKLSSIKAYKYAICKIEEGIKIGRKQN